MVTKVSEVNDIVKLGIEYPSKTFPRIRKLAESDDWKEREVAATALVEISKKKSDEVVSEMKKWSSDKNPNIRRTSSEGLRDIARKNPAQVLPIIENLKTDENLYVKKSVANILRNASRKDPDFVLTVCKKWAFAKDKNTGWIVKDGLRKLKETHKKDVEEILKNIS